jgi:hypothetical protein
MANMLLAEPPANLGLLFRPWLFGAGVVKSLGGGPGGGWNGPIAELALRALAFSSLSALKKKSNGDSSRRRSATCALTRGGVDESLEMELLSSVRESETLMLGDSGTDLEKKLGIGNADGAGEAWKVGPAYAAPFGVEIGLDIVG